MLPGNPRKLASLRTVVRRWNYQQSLSHGPPRDRDKLALARRWSQVVLAVEIEEHDGTGLMPSEMPTGNPSDVRLNLLLGVKFLFFLQCLNPVFTREKRLFLVASSSGTTSSPGGV